MKEKISWTVFIVLCATLVIFADDTKEFTLRKGIQNEQRKIIELSQKISELEKNQKDWQDNHTKSISDKKQEKESIDQEYYELKKRETQKKNELFALHTRIRKQTRIFSSLDSQLQQYLSRQQDLLQKSIPWDKDKKESQLVRLSADFAKNRYKTEELYDRFFTILYKDLLQGFDSSTYRKENFHYLRIGHVYLARTNFENNTAEILTQKQNAWAWMPLTDTLHIKAIQDAIRIIQGKKSPEYIYLPVSVSLIKEPAK